MVNVNNYKFEVITDKDQVEKYIEYSHERIIDLFKNCFNITDTNLDFIKNTTLFLCKTDNNKLIGIATNFDFGRYIKTEDPIEPYDPTVYTTDRKYGKSNKLNIYDKLGNLLSYDIVTLTPCIYSLCKDKSYKDVGRFLLDNISKYYKHQDYDKIYIVPESSNHRGELLTTNINNENFYHLLEKYKHDQTFLFKYYSKNGFVVAPDYYSPEILTLVGFDNNDGNDTISANILFYNIMYKKL